MILNWLTSRCSRRFAARLNSGVSNAQRRTEHQSPPSRCRMAGLTRLRGPGVDYLDGEK